MLELHTWGGLRDIATTYLLDFFLKTFTYIKIFNWKRKESNSNFQVRCAYQTTTNIALLWKMVRIPFLFPTRKKLSGIGSPTKKARVLIWTKKTFFEDFYIKISYWKRKESNSNFQVRCAYQTTTNTAILWEMVPILFLFPTRKNLSGIGSPTKRLGSWFGPKKITFWRLLHKDF